ncbi:MAG: AAA family ATPase [Kiritimatiellae bacterium]|nr:AAA family ATPase [Kiritimatiellia bacterium]
MYLKQLDIVGFKSFADRTRLTFDPGLIAIVGPNGCGKSNVSDAIRWVLGEQRPTALRCSKLVDVVFNGTDTRKPLGLAEVSITFADCEKELGTDYHEVTITRRVYRDGSGEYFINKQASRLKDVQHLFMGTGIGTSSYSVMAQGQIDAILSSKPEDRRAVFEEAAGITKFKADRKEALRKIDQTEQNLLREADILREMKRQIGSLQRQVGKAQRYKELRDELRGLDIYVSKQRIHDFDAVLEQNAANRMEVEKAISEASATVADAEARQQELHREIHELEERLQTLAQEQAAADGAYRRATEVIGVNRQRIEEYRSFAERDGREIADTRRQLEDVKMQAESLAQKTRLLGESLEAARASLEEAETAFNASQERMDALRTRSQNARAESVACDRRAASDRDEIARLEAAAREAIIRNERLAADEANLKAAVADAEKTLAEITARADAAREVEREAGGRFSAAKESLEKLRAEIQDAREHLGGMQAAAAAKEAQLAMLKDEAKAKKILESIFENAEGDVRLAAIETGREGVAIREGDRLVEHLALADDQVETAEQLLGDMVLAGGQGGTWTPSTSIEPISGHKSPITEAEISLADLNARIESARETLATGADRISALSAELSGAEARLAEARRAAAQAEGEEAMVKRDAAGARSRLDAVVAELAAAQAANAADSERREALARDLGDTVAKRDALLDSVSSMEEELRSLETENISASQRLTERRIAASRMEQELSFVGQQSETAGQRREELSRAIEGRESGIKGYEDSIRRLTEESEGLMDSLAELQEKAMDSHARMDDERVRRGEMMAKISAADGEVAEKRAELDRARDFRGKLEVQAAESTMRRQNIYDHLQDEYGLFADAVLREPDPEWKDGVVPPTDELESRVAKLQGDIAALGPVNMVAIDECRELEERYAREKAQEEDLLAAKTQIMDLIANLNTTSGEMFRTTFEQANRNFQTMFTKLFGGGEARLVLLENEEDPLECGIDIIARPPGKRPQSVTLLSGGERTMTAVALLFSIFMIKPAPFCMLDELDAALDDANIGRFVEQLKEFLAQSQFLIITHNQHTIAGSDLVYGVSQQEKGVSRIISMRLSDLGVKEKK